MGRAQKGDCSQLFLTVPGRNGLKELEYRAKLEKESGVSYDRLSTTAVVTVRFFSRYKEFRVKNIARRPYHQVRLVGMYRSYLEGREVKLTTAKGYCSQVISFLIMLAEHREVQDLSLDVEKGVIDLVRKGHTQDVRELRSSSVTALALTAERHDICDVLRELCSQRSLDSMRTFALAVRGFYLWLEVENLVEVNIYEDVWSCLEFRYNKFLNSIEQARVR